MTFAFYPDLPPLPDLPILPDSETFHQYRTISCNKNGVAIPNTVWTRHAINSEIEAWAKQNISPEFHTIGLNCCGTDTGGVGIPHTDRTRNWTLMWITDTGGTDVSTVFWQERGFEVEREPNYYPESYDDLIELESHVLEPNRWVLLNAKVIHSVENLQSVRKNIQLGFWDNASCVGAWTK